VSSGRVLGTQSGEWVDGDVETSPQGKNIPSVPARFVELRSPEVTNLKRVDECRERLVDVSRV
jgi:hypothetical protein